MVGTRNSPEIFTWTSNSVLLFHEVDRDNQQGLAHSPFPLTKWIVSSHFIPSLVVSHSNSMIQKHQCSTLPDFTGWLSIAQHRTLTSYIYIYYLFIFTGKNTNILPKKQLKKLHSQITLTEYGLIYYFLLSSFGNRMIHINTILQHTTFITAKHFFKKHFNLKLSRIFAIGANPLRSDSYSLLQLFSGK